MLTRNQAHVVADISKLNTKSATWGVLDRCRLIQLFVTDPEVAR